MDKTLSRRGAGFALAACVAIVFNTLLAWLKDSFAPVNAWMAGLTGHHWTTHGLFDLAVFIGLGLLFARGDFAQKLGESCLSRLLAACTVVAGAGLLLWFFLV